MAKNKKIKSVVGKTSQLLKEPKKSRIVKSVVASALTQIAENKKRKKE